MSPAAVKVDLIHLIRRETETGRVRCMKGDRRIFQISDHCMPGDHITALEHAIEQRHLHLRRDVLQYDLERNPVTALITDRWHTVDGIFSMVDAM